MTTADGHPASRPDADIVDALRGRGLGVGALVFEGALLVALLSALSILLVLLADVVSGALPTFRTRGIGFVLSGLSLSPDTAGVLTGIAGSVTIAAIVVALAFPVGVAAALYLEEYAEEGWGTTLVDTTVRNLAGVPSIVYGLLGLAVFVPLVDRIGLGGVSHGRNVIAAGITMAVLVLPIVIITSAEAIRAVPQTIREAGFGVGATRWEVIRHHVLPSALPGILTGTVLTLARALGETAPLLVIGVATGYFAPPANVGVLERLTGPYTALPVIVFSWSRQTRPEFLETLAPAAIVVLLGVLFTLNGAAVWLRNRHDRRW